MRISSPRLRRLDNALTALPIDTDAMMLSDLDGFVAGLILCPDRIPVEEWLPLVWSADGVATPFAEDDEALWYNGQVLDHYDAVERTLGKGAGHHTPFFEIDARSGEILWELWIEGFERAMALRAETWVEIAESDDETAAAAVNGMLMLADIAGDESDQERAEIDALTLEAPTLITRWIDTLNARRIERLGALQPVAPPPPLGKLGRNDPCPCGTGRKYKKCCGAN